MKTIMMYRKAAMLLLIVCCGSIQSNAQTSLEYSAHSVRVEGTVAFIPTGFLAYDYRPVDYLSVAVGFGSFALDDSIDIYKYGYMTRVGGLIGKNSKYFEICGGVMYADSKCPWFILVGYRYQPDKGLLWGTGIRFTYIPTDQVGGLVPLLSLAGLSFQFGYAF
ncbi:MAG: hypothetical protein IPM61_01735 [Chlorobi bacterium]|nr:hypothetical protein [Chlorobiota bacterium]MBX7217476.1 hypothetical protein [Candidatus Kapabacteria bacterium]